MKNKESHPLALIKDGIVNTLRIWMREYRLIFSDLGVMVIIFAVPLIYPLLYSFIYYPEVVRELPIAVVDLSHSTDSRQFTRNLDATPELKVTDQSPSMEDAIVLFKKRQVRGIIQIPESFSADLALGRQTTVSAYADMEFFLYYKALMTGASFVTLETGKEIQIRNLMNAGLTEREAMVTAEPIQFIDNAMANRS
jgi:ABC-2 type transport system permease protein